MGTLAILILTIPIYTTLTAWGCLNPFIAASIGTLLSNALNLNVFDSLTLVLGMWFVAWVAEGYLELAQNTTIDPTLTMLDRYSIIRPHTGIEPWVPQLARAVLFIALVLLPLGLPPNFLGWAALFFGFGLIMLNQIRKQDLTKALTYFAVQCVALGLVSKVYTAFNADITLLPLALIGSLSIPALFFAGVAPEDNDVDYTENWITDAFRAVLVLVGCWLTPGYTLATTAAFFMPRSPQRLATISVLSAALEGWVLHTFLFQLGGSEKSMLGYIMKSQLLLTGAEYTSAELWTLLITAVCLYTTTLVALQAMSWTNYQPPLQAIALTQAATILLALGAWAVPFLLVGLALYFLREVLEVPKDLRTLGLLVQM